jgi:hypothetical protein
MDEPALLRFYTDTHIAKAVADQLRARGVDVVRCEEVGRADARDVEHLEYATEQGRVVVTHDDDFLRLNREWQATGKSHAGIIYCLPHLQGGPYVGTIIKACLDYYDLITGGAGTIEDDIVNQIIFVS